MASRQDRVYSGGDKRAVRHLTCPRDTDDPDDVRLCSQCRRVVIRRIARKQGRA